VVIVLIVVLAIILMVVLGVALVGLALKLLWWALVGLVIGSLARLVLPGAHPIGWLATIGAGIAGALLGGIVGDALDWGGLLEFLLSIAAAALLIAALGGTRRIQE
jgi:uncharacterized membrane protein YeaQ/YmgE (transglycosylase-associated protein family)